MRIISGKHQRIILNTPTNNDIRPTMDRAKEGLFNIINYNIIDSDFLDLFSGTGSIGIEAISRGANKVVLVDSSNIATNLIKDNLTKIKEEARVYNMSAFNFLTSCNETFDYIFMDPPYDIKIEEVDKLCNVILESKLLNPGATIFVELDQKYQNDNFTIRHKKYGKSIFTILKEKDE